jgi:hypothetical protein
MADLKLGPDGKPLTRRVKTNKKMKPSNLLKRVNPTQPAVGTPGMRGSVLGEASALHAMQKAEAMGATSGVPQKTANLTQQAAEFRQRSAEKMQKVVGSAKGVGLASSIQANTVGVTGTQKPIGMADRHPVKQVTDTKRTRKGKAIAAKGGSTAQAAAAAYREKD